MPVYTSPDQLYTALGETITRAQQHAPQALAAMHKARLIVRMKFANPAAEMLVNGRRNPLHIAYGPHKTRPELELHLQADTFHRILLDELSIKAAVAQGLIKVRGPVWKLKPLGEVIRAGKAHYPAVLAEMGLGE